MKKITFLFLFVFSNSVFSGHYIVTKTITGYVTPQLRFTRMYITQDKLRLDIEIEEKIRSTIYNSKTKQLIVYDRDNKQFVDFKDKIKDTLTYLKSKDREDESQGFMMEQNYSETIKRWICKKFTLKDSGKLKQHMWVTSWLEAGIPDPSLFSIVEEYQKQILSLIPVEQTNKPAFFLHGFVHKEFSGYPVKSVFYNQGKPLSTTELLKSKKKEFADSVFEIPKNATKVDYFLSSKDSESI